MKHLFTLSVFSLAMLSHPTWAECSGKWALNVDRSNVEFKRDLAAYIPVYLELSRDIQGCRFPMAMVSVNNKQSSYLSSTGTSLPLTILDKNYRQLSHFPNKGFQLPLDSSQRTKFWLKIPEAKVAASGNYTGLLEATISLGKKQKTQNAKVKLKVPAFVAFNSAANTPNLQRSSQSGYRFQLGDLESNRTYRSDFDLLSNSSVRLVVKQKYGELRQKSEPNITIPYTLRFNNTSVNQQATYTFSNNESTKRWGIPLEVTLGNIEFARAGKYQDTIIVEVKAMP
ncbi:hypothetical protein [Vibrio sp. AND4]|uniref:hypothetical protein n=1 Tax=Vibrio sp. AND4 TaxID=314289 RepID=UPI00015F0376|nr:hypothetical protein [Vibrio sp. AND4]EDP58676.1 hypothetical protein AND4_14596 [Vibrio sp. AND4]